MNRVYAPLVYWRSPNNVSPDPCFFTSIYGLALLVVYYSLHFPLLITSYTLPSLLSCFASILYPFMCNSLNLYTVTLATHQGISSKHSFLHYPKWVPLDRFLALH